MAKNTKLPRDYEVGYAKPPKKTRFRKGQSGNSAGRSKGVPNLATALDRALKEKVVVIEGGQRRVISKMELMVVNMLNKAALGDPRSRQQVLQMMLLMDEQLADSTPDETFEAEDEEIFARIVDRIRNSHEED